MIRFRDVVTLLSVACIAACGLMLVLVAHDATGFLLLFLAIAMSAAMAVIQIAEAGQPCWWARKRGWSYAADQQTDPKRKP